MTEPGRRAVSYLPGRWAALVTDELCLLSELQLADPGLAACWDAATAPNPAEQVIETLTRSGQQQSFVLVARTGGGMRLVVAGRAHAEVFAGAQQPVVRRPPNPLSWIDETLDPALDVRLVADDATPFERISPLPLTSGIVLASFVFTTAAAVVAPAGAPPPDEPAGWIPPPLAQPSSELPVPQVAGDPGWPSEPAAQLSGVFRALPWRTSFAEPDAVLDEAPAGGGLSGYGSGPADNPPYGGSFEPRYAEPPYPPPAPGDASTQRPTSAPLVQAVHCSNGHPNPLHVDVCRICGAGFSPQQPVTVARPPLGVLRVATGEVVLLDQDVLLGRAPFAVDLSGVRLVEVPSPENDISRSHLRITLDGWQVFATDLGSTNGTAVTLPGRAPTLLRPHDPFALDAGSVLSLADEADVRFDLQ